MIRQYFNKLSLILLFCLTLYSTCQASDSHFYVGGGLSTLIANNKLDLYRASSGGTFQSLYDSGNTFGGQVFAGYQKVYTSSVIAGEAGLRGMIGRSSGTR